MSAVDELIAAREKLAAHTASSESTLREHRSQTQIKVLREQIKGMTREMDALHEALGIVQDLEAAPRPKSVKRREKAGCREATAVVLCTDWHVEERVDPSTVLGKNEYNPAIVRARVKRLIDAIVWGIAQNRHAFAIRDLVIWLGGDLITGYIHEELLEGNFMSPTEAVLFAQELIESMLDAALKIPGIERVIVPCSYGNHGRTTAKPRISSGAKNSFEWLMYQQLKRRYAHEPRIEFAIAGGEHIYVDLYGYNIRFNHGDPIRSQGGIGGVMVPAKRTVSRWQTMQHAHLTCLGHHHQRMHVRDICINGSLIGWNPYGIRIGAEYEPPQQSMFFIDSKRGMCVEFPLWVDEEVK